MKTFAFFLNFLLPGIGSFFVGKILEGIAQVFLSLLGTILTLTGILSIIGIPMLMITIAWATYCVATTFNLPESHRQYKINT